MSTEQIWNPRYVLYAKSQGRAPEEQRAYDAEAWPGGPACGFMLWMSERRQELQREFGLGEGFSGLDNFRLKVSDAEWTGWLERWVEKTLNGGVK